MRQITEADVGKRFRRRDGAVVLVAAFRPNHMVPVLITGGEANDYPTNKDGTHPYDLVECLDDVKEDTGKDGFDKSMCDRVPHAPKEGDTVFDAAFLKQYNLGIARALQHLPPKKKVWKSLRELQDQLISLDEPIYTKSGQLVTRLKPSLLIFDWDNYGLFVQEEG